MSYCSGSPPRQQPSLTKPATPGKWWDNQQQPATQPATQPIKTRAKRQRERRKQRRLAAQIQSIGQPNQSEEHRLRKRAKQKQRQAKRTFKEGVEKAKEATIVESGLDKSQYPSSSSIPTVPQRVESRQLLEKAGKQFASAYRIIKPETAESFDHFHNLVLNNKFM